MVPPRLSRGTADPPAPAPAAPKLDLTPVTAAVEWLHELAATKTLNSTSQALENSRVVKSGQGYLMGLLVYNSNAAAQFVQVFDTEGVVPVNGAVPVVLLSVAGASTATLTYVPLGRWCAQGIVVCNSSTAASLTIGAADCFFDVQYV